MRHYLIIIAAIVLLTGVAGVTAAHAGLVNGDFGAGLTGWTPDGGDFADWWVADGALNVRTHSHMTNLAWITNAVVLPAGVYACSYDVNSKYGAAIMTAVGVGIGSAESTAEFGDTDGWLSYSTVLTTDGGLFRLGLITRTDSQVYFDNIYVEAVPEAASFVALAVGLMGCFGGAARRKIR